MPYNQAKFKDAARAAPLRRDEYVDKKGKVRRDLTITKEQDDFYEHLESLSDMALRGMIRRLDMNPDEFGNRESMIQELMYQKYGE